MTAQLSPTPVFKGFADNGTPLAYGLLYSYAAGTSTPQATYIDSTQTTPNTNPIVLNARGECALWLDPTLAYKFNLTDKDGNQISGYPVDNIIVDTTLPIDSLNLHYDITTAETNAGVVPVSYQYPPYNSYRYMTAAQIVDVQGITLTTDNTASLTTLFSIKQGNGAVYAVVNPGFYGIQTGITISTAGVYIFQEAPLVPTGTSAQPYLVQWQAGYCKVYNFEIEGNYNANYACGMLWNSLGAAPSQSNDFFDLTINNILSAIIYGAVSTPAFAVQSENYIHGCHMIGVQNCILMNQSGGLLKIIGGQVNASQNGWGAAYIPANSWIANVEVGALFFFGCDMEKPAINTGVGLINTGGDLQICGGTWEIACQNLQLSGGYTNISDISGEYWSNASVSWCVMNGSPTYLGQLHISNFVLNKDPAASAAVTAFIDFGGQTNWDVSLTDVRLENQLHIIFNNGSAQPDFWIGNTLNAKNVECPSVPSVATPSPTLPLFPAFNTYGYNLLDLRGADVTGVQDSAWYSYDTAGTGTITLNADVPAGSTYFKSLQDANTGSSSDISDFTNMNVTNLADIQASAIRVRPGNQFLLSGWFKVVSTPGSNVCSVEAFFAGTTGSVVTEVDIVDTSTVLSTSWQYITGMFTVPASCAYMGIGMRVTDNTVRMIGLSLAKLSPGS